MDDQRKPTLANCIELSRCAGSGQKDHVAYQTEAAKRLLGWRQRIKYADDETVLDEMEELRDRYEIDHGCRPSLDDLLHEVSPLFLSRNERDESSKHPTDWSTAGSTTDN